MNPKKKVCPDCEAVEGISLERRDFLKTVGVGAAAAATGSLPLFAVPKAQAAPTPRSTAETAVTALYRTLSEDQKRQICFDWDHRETGGRNRGLLRTFIHIAPQAIPRLDGATIDGRVLLFALAWSQAGLGFAARLAPIGFLLSIVVMRKLYATCVSDVPLSTPISELESRLDWTGTLLGLGVGLTLVAIVAYLKVTSALVAIVVCIVLIFLERWLDAHASDERADEGHPA